MNNYDEIQNQVCPQVGPLPPKIYGQIITEIKDIIGNQNDWIWLPIYFKLKG